MPRHLLIQGYHTYIHTYTFIHSPFTHRGVKPWTLNLHTSYLHITTILEAWGKQNRGGHPTNRLIRTRRQKERRRKKKEKREERKGRDRKEKRKKEEPPFTHSSSTYPCVDIHGLWHFSLTVWSDTIIGYIIRGTKVCSARLHCTAPPPGYIMHAALASLGHI